MTALSVLEVGPVIDTTVDLSGDTFAEWIDAIPCTSFREEGGWVHEYCDGNAYLAHYGSHLTKNVPDAPYGEQQEAGAFSDDGGVTLSDPSPVGHGTATQTGGLSVPAKTPATFPDSPSIPGTSCCTGPIIVKPVVDPAPMPVPLPSAIFLILITIAALITLRAAWSVVRKKAPRPAWLTSIPGGRVVKTAFSSLINSPAFARAVQGLF